MSDRRTFLRQLGATIGAGAAAPARLHAQAAGFTGAGVAPFAGDAARGMLRIDHIDHIDRIETLGVQLYTVRDLMKADVEGTLARVAQAGYGEVEFAGYFGRTPAQVRAALASAGLKAPSAHIGAGELAPANWPAVLDTAHAIGHEWLVLAWIGDQYTKSADGYKAVADLLLAAADSAKRAGIRLAYHNHDFEFKPLPGNTIGYDVLLERTRGSTIAFEMDLCWIAKAGRDPMAYWLKWPERFPMVHVKDAVFAPAFAMKDVGAGTINWSGLFREHVQAGIQHYFVEHDQPTDPMASITASATYLKQLTF